MAKSSQNGKLIFAAVVLVFAGGWMIHTWNRYGPIRAEQTSAVRRSQAERTQANRTTEELTPEQRVQRSHRQLGRRLELTETQMTQMRRIERQLLAQDDYHEREFRAQLRQILTDEQKETFRNWQAERRAAREARESNT